MTETTPATSAELHAACHSPDPVMRAAGYERLWPHVLRAAYQIVRDQPAAEALAQDCAQLALVRVHDRLGECREPNAFRAWAQRIAARIALDELRRRKRLVPLIDEAPDEDRLHPAAGHQPSFEAAAAERIDRAGLRALIERAPISDRSRRVVIGRFFDTLPDEELAQTESELSGQTVRPSHIQVTRTKDIARLREWPPLRAFLKGV